MGGIGAVALLKRFGGGNPYHKPAGPGGGQFTSGPGGPSIREDMSKQGNAPQPVKTLDELYQRAKEDEAAFKKEIEDFAKAVKGKAVFTPAQFAEPGTILKSRSSAERKLKSELDNDVTQLKDVLRGTIQHENMTDTRKAASDFIGAMGDRVLRVKDRIATVTDGYRDILVNYRTPGGLVGEMQFNTRTMLETKAGEGHKIYEQMRSLPKNTHPKLIAALNRKNHKLYDNAYQASGDSAWRQHS